MYETMSNHNIVVVAKNLNPSIFSQNWLIKRGIFSEGDIEGAFLFSPMAVNVQTPQVELLIVPERLQLKFRTDDDHDEINKRIIGNIVTALPETPYTGMGLNIDWIITPHDQSEFPNAIREMFMSDKNPLESKFSNRDARFGVYMSMDMLEMRLKLNIKPIKSVIGKEKIEKEGLSFNFNFDKRIDNQEKAVDIIMETLNKWSQAKEDSEKMVKEISEKWNS